MPCRRQGCCLVTILSRARAHGQLTDVATLLSVMADEFAERAIEADPRDPIGYQLLGNTFFMLGEGLRRSRASGGEKEARMTDCVFCRIVEGELPAAKVYEDGQTVAFMDAGQVNPGHVLVAARSHRETILDLVEDTAGAVFRTASKVARAVDAAFNPEGITILQANKSAGW